MLEQCSIKWSSHQVLVAISIITDVPKTMKIVSFFGTLRTLILVRTNLNSFIVNNLRTYCS